jgi:hypothetical protein
LKRHEVQGLSRPPRVAGTCKCRSTVHTCGCSRAVWGRTATFPCLQLGNELHGDVEIAKHQESLLQGEPHPKGRSGSSGMSSVPQVPQQNWLPPLCLRVEAGGLKQDVRLHCKRSKWSWSFNRSQGNLLADIWVRPKAGLRIQGTGRSSGLKAQGTTKRALTEKLTT